MKYYPLLLDLHGQRVVVVGGGIVAERKVRTLLRCGAEVVLISPSLTAGLRSLVKRGAARHHPRPYRPGDLRGAGLALAAANDPEVQEAVAREARRRNVWVNVVDRPSLCRFIAPAVLTRGDLLIAISTGGASPALAQRLRRDLDRWIGRAYPEFLRWLASARRLVFQKIPSQSRRRRIFHRLADSGLPELLKQGRRQEARERFSRLLAQEGLADRSSLSQVRGSRHRRQKA